MNKTVEKILNDRLNNGIIGPITRLIDENISDIVTTFGRYFIRTIRGKLQRGITINIGESYSDWWFETALYSILNKYNDIKKCTRVELGILPDDYGTNPKPSYLLESNQAHNLKYRNWNILVVVVSNKNLVNSTGKYRTTRSYTIITSDTSPKFIKTFEEDMIRERDKLLKIDKNSPYINIYGDSHEYDGSTYWYQMNKINKRKLGTVYIPNEQKKLLVDTLNNFFAGKKYYQEHGIPHNLKILLYGPPGPQPVDTIIPTPSGNIKLDDLRPGDKVYSITGDTSRIEEIYEYDDLDVYKITFSDGRVSYCGKDHEWPTITSRGNIQRRRVCEMIDKGLIGSNGRSRFSIPLGPQVLMDNKHVPIDPYVLGVFIGNGNLTQLNLTLSASDESIPKKIAKICHFDVKKRSDDPFDYNWIFYDKTFGKPIKTNSFFKEIPFLINSKSYDRYIPNDYIFNSYQNRLRIIQGLMDTDGSISESKAEKDRKEFTYGVSYSSTSKQLIENMSYILRSLGYRISINIDSRIEKYTTEYCANIRIQINDSEKYKLFRFSNNKVNRSLKARFRKYDRKFNAMPTIQIINIEKCNYISRMKCLHIDDPSHIYLTNDFIPTCNSGKDSLVKVIASEWNRNIYYITGGKGGKYIPNALTDTAQLINPLLLISDIDKYPFLTNEATINLADKDDYKEEQLQYKQLFGNMINALDGIISGEDKLIIMTTNHPEVFSETFLRNGRVDLSMHIDYMTPETFRKYVYDFYGTELPENIELKYDNLSVAKLNADVIFLKMSKEDFIKKYVK